MFLSISSKCLIWQHITWFYFCLSKSNVCVFIKKIKVNSRTGTWIQIVKRFIINLFRYCGNNASCEVAIATKPVYASFMTDLICAAYRNSSSNSTEWEMIISPQPSRWNEQNFSAMASIAPVIKPRELYVEGDYFKRRWIGNVNRPPTGNQTAVIIYLVVIWDAKAARR